MNFYTLFLRHLRAEEGYDSLAYLDSEGVWTVGYGTTWYADGTPVAVGDVVTRGQAENLLRMHAYTALSDASDYYPDFQHASQVRQLVLGSMAYQMGINRLEKFVNSRAALDRGNWLAFSVEILDSKWAREQSPNRALRLSNAARDDIWPDNVAQVGTLV